MLDSVLVVAPLAAVLLLPLALAAVLYRLRVREDSRRRRLAATCFLAGVVLTLPPAAVALWPGWCVATPRGDLAAADSFVVFSFGLGPGVNGRPTAGKSNRALAEWLVANNPAKKPAVVQEGVYLALRELEESRPGLLAGWTVVRLPERPGFYIDTNGAAFQADAALAQLTLRRPVLVAHDLQLWRMDRSFAAIGLTDVVVPEMPPTPFDPGSVQHCGTRSRACWLVREAFAARPLTLAPHTTAVALAAIALLYGIVIGRVWGREAMGRR